MLSVETGFPPGVVNVTNSFGSTTGTAILRQMQIEKVAFTGSTLVGRELFEATAKIKLEEDELQVPWQESKHHF